MKKIIIMMMVVLMALPLAFASDFSTPYLEQDNKLLRATDDVTNINYTEFSSCSVTLGGSEFRGNPFTYESTSTYKHNSLIVTYDTSIKQYGIDCSVQDTYNVGGTILSKTGIINGAILSGIYYSPQFAFIYKKSVDNTLYLQVLTLDEETSKLKFYSETSITTSFSNDTDDYFGVVGGCLSASNNLCTYDERVFGYYDNFKESAVRVYGNDDFNVVYLHNTVDTYVNGTSHNNEIWFDDWNNDGWNEFIILGVGTDDTKNITAFLTTIQPLTIAPYYYKVSETHVLGAQSSNLVNLNSFWNLTNYQSYNLCQIGDIDSGMELCYSVGFDNTINDNQLRNGYVNNEFTGGYNYDVNIAGEFISRPMFTYDVDGDNDIDYCMYYPATSYRVVCKDENGSISSYYNDSSHTNINLYPYEIFVANIDNNSDTIELIYSDGEISSVNFDTRISNIGLTDWFPAFTTAQYGQMYVQDLNDDDYSEFIYIDDVYLKIYSMNSTAYVFQNSSEFLTGEDTSDTSTTVDPDISAAEESNMPVIIYKLNTNIKTITGLILIIMAVVGVAMLGVTSPIILMFVAIISSVLGNILGLISTSILVIILVSSVLLMLLGMTIFKTSNGE